MSGKGQNSEKEEREFESECVCECWESKKARRLGKTNKQQECCAVSGNIPAASTEQKRGPGTTGALFCGPL